MIDETLFDEWLAEKTHGTGRKHGGHRIFPDKGRHEDDRGANVQRDQVLLQFQAAETRHVHVDDQAGRVVHSLGLQELLCRSKHRNTISHRSYQTPGGFTKGPVVVDDRYHWSILQSAILFVVRIPPEESERRKRSLPLETERGTYI